MLSPPTIRRRSYKGRQPAKQREMAQENEVCIRLEKEIARRWHEMKPGETQTVLSYEVARETGVDVELAKKLLNRIDGSGNGFILHRSVG